MGQETKIECVHHQFSPWQVQRESRVVAAESAWKEPLKWDLAAKKAGERHRVFCASFADVFEDWQGPMVDSDGHELFGTLVDDFWTSENRNPDDVCDSIDMQDLSLIHI